MRLLEIKVSKLFDTFDYKVALKRDERVTLLYGPNGYGKTTILRLIEAAGKGNLRFIRSIPFRSLELIFDDSSSLVVVKPVRNDTSEQARFTLELRKNGASEDIREFKFDPSKQQGLDAIEQRFPHLRQIDENLWEDMTDGEVITASVLARRYGIDLEREEDSEVSKWLRRYMSKVNIRFIDAQRLTRSSPSSNNTRRLHRTNMVEATSVSNYSKQLSRRIQGLLGEYAEKSQRLDQSFPTRVLEIFQTDDTKTISDEDLAKRFSELDDKVSRLRKAGLLEKEEEIVALPEAVKPEVKRVLNVYLNDVTQKLGVFDSTLRRIELMRELIDEHFSFKNLLVSREHGIRFQTQSGKVLPVASLSSGEQHMLILVYELLFQEDQDSLLLIDEPEISLHISWQLSFLSDLERIANVSRNDVLIATHSPQIIGDRTDLTIDLLEEGLEVTAE